jgi:ABC-type nitrate/sulfonate/bicarbonate transport system substrate-binding protein
MRFTKFVMLFAACGMFGISGCGSDAETENAAGPATTPGQLGETTIDAQGPLVTVKVAPSEYPSWSAFMTAEKAGFVNGKAGEMGTVEEKYNVDIVLDVNDYDTCLQKYGAGTVDAVCITNTDILPIAESRKSTAICPTSTSDGADAVITVGVDDLEGLKAVTTYGLAKSVSQFCFVAALKAKGQNPADFKFENLDPEAAATKMQTGSPDVKAICVWNPFKMQTLRKTKGSKNVLDSTAIPEQIIDMVVMANESLEKPGGDRAAQAICAVFYAINEKLADQETRDATTTALGEDFSNLNLEDMRLCLTETSFYSTPQDGTKLFESEKFQTKTMPAVVATCQEIGILETGKQPTVGYNDSSKQLNFSTKYMKAVTK